MTEEAGIAKNVQIRRRNEAVELLQDPDPHEPSESDGTGSNGDPPKLCGRRVGRVRTQLTAILLITAACLLQSGTFAVVKTVRAGPSDTALYLGVALFVLAGGPVVKSGPAGLGGRAGLKLLAVRGVLGVTGYQLWFYTLKNLPLSEAVLLRNIAPGLTVLLAWAVLKERPGVTEVVAILLMLAGVVLITEPAFIFGEIDTGLRDAYPNRTLAIVLSCANSCVEAGIMVSLRKMGLSLMTPFGPPFSVGVVTVTVLPIVIAAKGAGFPTPDCGAGERPLILLIGCLLLMSHVLSCYALRYLNAGVSSGLRTQEMFFAFLIQYFILNEYRNSRYAFVGGAAIMTASVMIAVKIGLVSSKKHCCSYC